MDDLDQQNHHIHWYDKRLMAILSDYSMIILSIIITWCLLYVNLTPYLMAVPGGSIASFFILYVAGYGLGWLVEKLANLPPLLGMLVAGIVIQNLGLYNVEVEWCIKFVAIAREAALTVILIKGGLGLDADQLRRLSGTVTKLTLTPCITEAIAVAVAAHYLIPQFSWEWSLSLGFSLSAVSPAVLVPRLLSLRTKGYGEVNGVNTLLIAGSSLDDIVSISAFGVLLGLAISEGDLINKIVQGPIDVCIGIVIGLLWGAVLIFVPPSPWAQNVNSDDYKLEKNNRIDTLDQSTTAKRSLLLGAGGFLAVRGSLWFGFPGAGPLACIISAFVANTGWKWKLEKYNDSLTIPNNAQKYNPTQENSVEKIFDYFWIGLEPVLFSFIGTEVKLKLLQESDIIFTGILIIIFGLIIRLIATTLSIWGAGFSRKESVFINIAWLPKATVQAALAPVALNAAREHGKSGDEERAIRLCAIAVLSILMTAPVGALGIQWFGLKLLPKLHVQE
ncbi:sodium/hydrogen exchanger 9B2-like [Daktulosphaira vitifoliae]|uniref:sodium/hydrogen exchanger 9B2-like n=1 Tax=Daktulosphaira vitifoliae TaxID=58002 RepID=UPI0021A9D82F|nr:sodium/hydrogen exchanger 9B2-like [Daktulosphaira vitifoliae]